MTNVQDVIYKTVGQTELHMHIHVPAQPGTGQAAIIFFHGGGWRNGTPKQFHEHCKYLAARGMVACSAQYRLVGSTGENPFQCVADGKSAIRWLKIHAAEYGVDPTRVAAGGGSAGGHVAAACGTLDGHDEADEDPRVPSRPDALVLFNPVIDTTPGGWESGSTLLGSDGETLSPVHHVDAQTPPAIVFHGTADPTVPIENVREFARRMAAAGNRCELEEFEGEEHGFFNYGRAGNVPYARTVELMDRFLVSLGYLQEGRA